MNSKVFFAIAYKQFKDIIKNKTIFLQFIIFPLITMLLLIVIKDKNITNSIPMMFATIFIGMTPLTCMASIIAEEKEKMTLTALKFAFVKSFEYLTGIGYVILLACIVINIVFSCLISGDIILKLKFFFVLMLGIIPSMILGAVLGLLSKNQMSIASLVSPVSFILSLLPLFSTFNKNIRNFSRFLYTQQINDILNNISGELSYKKIIVIISNALLFVILFAIVYKKRGLRSQ